VILRTAPALLAALLVAGCGHGATDAPRAAAVGFEQALAARDGGQACSLLAPKTRSALESSEGEPCTSAVLAQELPASTAVRLAEQYGSQSRVVLAEDTLFLSRFSIGWRVVAAGCRDRGTELPYDCRLSGQ
jgi:hypothetical protein